MTKENRQLTIAETASLIKEISSVLQHCLRLFTGSKEPGRPPSGPGRYPIPKARIVSGDSPQNGKIVYGKCTGRGARRMLAAQLGL